MKKITVESVLKTAKTRCIANTNFFFIELNLIKYFDSAHTSSSIEVISQSQTFFHFAL